jgi:ElaB/YqjD/DUF883 family membrane-anchored ribosome-binding protein
MLKTIKIWILEVFFNDLVQKQLDAVTNSSKTAINNFKADYENQLTKQRQIIQRQEDMLANRNFKAIVAQQLYITDHAIHQYRKRIGYGGSTEELRKMIYKQTIKHLAVMDKLPDGHYKISSKAAVRVKDNTVCTVVKTGKIQS